MTRLSPAEELERNVVLTPEQIAYIAGLVHRSGAKKGQPDRRPALELIRKGVLPLVDPSQPVTRWTVPVGAVRRYLAGEEARAS